VDVQNEIAAARDAQHTDSMLMMLFIVVVTLLFARR
jgi:hypothetical protein